MLFFLQTKERKNQGKMENMSELMRQARVFLMNNPHVLPLHHVEEIALYGSVDTYVVARGVDINTPEGSHILNWESALYIVCLERCNMGIGDRPYLPHPYVRNPGVVEGEAAPNVGVPADQHMGHPGGHLPAQVDPVQPPFDYGAGVRVVGPFRHADLFPPPPPLVPAPAAYQPQPLHWVFRENPGKAEPKPKVESETKVEPKSEQEAAPGQEYYEPYEEQDNKNVTS
jgi:hypothetical protein